ncbi:Transcription factor iws1 [Apophysomyces ossiformis]|uniref:Transcription factor iws1 n=1 Tax=Apophysomyces ossiformis TaxID=679940 RepID=A0A8H7EUR3_9FUNG|nr:Transcription factor iws1 [Apophysomyces ossiformis]
MRDLFFCLANYKAGSDVDQAEPETAAQPAAPESKPQKLPSFKKRTREISEEESAKLEAVRRELREKRKEGDAATEGTKEEEIDPQQALRDEIDRQFAKALASGKKKRKRMNEDDLERSMDEELSNLRERMKNAAEEDAIANSNKKPAISKLKMLSEVTSMLNNKLLQDSILDNQLLDTIRLWLEPLPDRSLPALDIQTEMLDVMDNLPIASDHLRESGVGKIVYFYTKSPRVETRVRRKAEQLVARWSRLVIKRSENYRERRHEQREFRQEDIARRPKNFRTEAEEEDIDSRRMHVRIPQAVAADYDIMPQSVVRVDKTKNKPDTSFKRLREKMRSIKTGQKRSTPKVSIQGKDLGV